ncbi:F-box domain containing protein [Panicum miliaceum]|uniref:F-box domain containing protein n=1 Tax=Panicum miliaceum TaxID=4540 RepID=A0A3L6Q2I6_PANMI|nr:F-box domain containing protein [Panicum miliaceum]
MAAPAASGADHISALPDGVLQHVLGFHEADEAVPTSVLARRWSCLWRFMAALRVTRGGTVSSSRYFVDRLLDLRGRSPLDACLFRFTYDIGYYDSPPGDDVTCLNRWIRHALSQGVQELSVDVRVEVNADLFLQIVQFILKRDLRFCPTFSKLKSLLLSGWCVVGEQRALACILQHSPILEKLTIFVYGDQLADELPEVFQITKQIVPSRAIYNSMERSFTMENLNTVEVKCHEVNQWIFDIMKSLITYGIPLQKISIQQKSRSSESQAIQETHLKEQGNTLVIQGNTTPTNQAQAFSIPWIKGPTNIGNRLRSANSSTSTHRAQLPAI